MRANLIYWLVFTVLVSAAVIPIRAQAGPSAVQYQIPVVFGAGESDFAIDWGNHNRMQGVTAWIDVYPPFPAIVHGLGVEVEGHDINFGRPAVIPKMRQDTGLIGPMYDWDRYRNFHPYGKYLMGLGSIDFPPAPSAPNYSHDTFLVFAPGGGAQYRIWGNLWVRGDYEYQFWHHTFGNNDLNPNGFSIGASYDLRGTGTRPR